MNSPPGMRDGRSVTPRQILKKTEMVRYISGVIKAGTNAAPVAYDGGNTGYEDELRAGCIMGVIAASGLWRPCPRTQVNMTGATTTTVTVDDARAFVVGDTLTVGSNTGWIPTAIDYATNIMTGPSITVVDNTAVFCEDGSGTARAILGEFIKLKDYDDMVRRDKTTSRLIIAGFIDEDMILGDLAAVRAATGMYLSQIQWDDQHGMS